MWFAGEGNDTAYEVGWPNGGLTWWKDIGALCRHAFSTHVGIELNEREVPQTMWLELEFPFLRCRCNALKGIIADGTKEELNLQVFKKRRRYQLWNQTKLSTTSSNLLHTICCRWWTSLNPTSITRRTISVSFLDSRCGNKTTVDSPQTYESTFITIEMWKIMGLSNQSSNRLKGAE